MCFYLTLIRYNETRSTHLKNMRAAYTMKRQQRSGRRPTQPTSGSAVCLSGASSGRGSAKARGLHLPVQEPKASHSHLGHPFTMDSSLRRLPSCLQVPSQDQQLGFCVPLLRGKTTRLEGTQAPVQGGSVAATELENGVFQPRDVLGGEEPSGWAQAPRPSGQGRRHQLL